jgi:hypothetical protein
MTYILIAVGLIVFGLIVRGVYNRDERDHWLDDYDF